jgi:sugar phosphate isomerase/epimerase
MELGIFTKTFNRPSLAETMDAVAGHGLRSVQFNLACAGLEPMPDQIPPGVAEHIRDAADQRDIGIAALSGTFNMIHPDPRVRQQGIDRLRTLAAIAEVLGTSVITLCTGTRDPDNMWRRHPGNDSPDAWRDLVATVEPALAIADEYNVTLAFEPEPANVVNSAARGLRLLEQMRSPRLAVVVDPANIVATDSSREPAVVLTDAFELLGDRLAVAHAKDLGTDGEPCAAGKGIVPWNRYISLLQEAGFGGPLILHGLGEDEVATAVGFLQERLKAPAVSG